MNKGGRPPNPNPAKRRSKAVSTSWTPTEHKRLRKRAYKEGISVAGLIYKHALLSLDRTEGKRSVR